MANLRKTRARIQELLAAQDWEAHLGEIAAMGQGACGALFSMLSRDARVMHRAARALGLTVAKIYAEKPEAARDIVRRYMWHMNEDSGNIGWGMPPAFAETLAACPALAKDYASILISYIMDLGFADNYCDHDVLRRDCYWAVGRLAQAHPALAEKARPWLLKGLADNDAICRGMAAWALGQLGASMMDAPALRKLAESGNAEPCAVFDVHDFAEQSVCQLARNTLEQLVK